MAVSREEGHEPANGLTLAAGAQGTTEYTFEATGELLVGCHEPGHYDGGMVATITVEG